jgi:hypothetical protein
MTTPVLFMHARACMLSNGVLFERNLKYHHLHPHPPPPPPRATIQSQKIKIKNTRKPHGALTPFSVGLHVARTGFKLRSPKMAFLQPKNPISHHFRPKTAQKRLRNGYRTAGKRLSAWLALLLVVMNDRGKFHSHRARHRGG